MRNFAAALALLILVPAAIAQDELPQFPAADAKAIEKLVSLGAGATALAINTNAVSVNFSLAGTKVTDAQLEALKGVSGQLVWLNLGGTAVTDAGLAQVSGLKNLRRLHLERTAVTDAGLAALKGLSELRYLNLYGTKVTDKGLAALSGLKKLTSLYVWQTEVTEAGQAELVKALPALYVNRGAELPVPPKEEPKAKPINAKCPVSGKDIDAANTVLYKAQSIAFCCDKCPAKFEKEPAKYIGKVPEFKEPVAAADPAKPINAKCPISGKDIDAATAFVYKTQAIAFCCNNCRGKFEKEPAKYIGKVAEFKEPAVAAPAKAINAKCPMTGEDVDAAVTFKYKGQTIAFCCKDCCGKFAKEPAKYIGKVAEFKDPDKK